MKEFRLPAASTKVTPRIAKKRSLSRCFPKKNSFRNVTESDDSNRVSQDSLSITLKLHCISRSIFFHWMLQDVLAILAEARWMILMPFNTVEEKLCENASQNFGYVLDIEKTMSKWFTSYIFTSYIVLKHETNIPYLRRGTKQKLILIINLNHGSMTPKQDDPDIMCDKFVEIWDPKRNFNNKPTSTPDQPTKPVRPRCLRVRI